MTYRTLPWSNAMANTLHFDLDSRPSPMAVTLGCSHHSDCRSVPPSMPHVFIAVHSLKLESRHKRVKVNMNVVFFRPILTPDPSICYSLSLF